jgi:hypothetical protein
MKLSIIKILSQFYKSNDLEMDLFSFNSDFHIKTLQIIFCAIELLNDSIETKELVSKALNLLIDLTSIQSFIPFVISHNNLSYYLNLLLNFDELNLKISITKWMSDLLENQMYDKDFAYILVDREVLNKLFDSLHSSLNSVLSK